MTAPKDETKLNADLSVGEVVADRLERLGWLDLENPTPPRATKVQMDQRRAVVRSIIEIAIREAKS